MTLAEVRLWGRRIGAVSWDEDARLASFEYDPAFRESGIEVSPIVMPLGDRIYQFPGLPEASFRGLPGMLADSLPDRYGHALIDAWLARRGRAPESFTPVERLCYVGTRGMGALEYQPATGPEPSTDDVDVAALVELAEAILSERRGLSVTLDRGEEALNHILAVGTSAGGARAKAIVAWNPETAEIRTGQAGLEPGFEHWILKLDGVRSSDDREVGPALGYGRIEYAYSVMARKAGIAMTDCRLFEEGDRAHFMTKRFDRTDHGGKLHLQSLAALSHFDYHAAGAYSCEQAVEVMRRLDLPAREIEQQFRRTVLNVVARNQDDHVKNIAFLMDQTGEWRLSPAFDVTYSYNPAGRWTSRHQMTVNGKRDGIELEDLRAFGRFCNLKRPRSDAAIDEVRAAVDQWPSIADEAGIPGDRVRAVRRSFRFR